MLIEYCAKCGTKVDDEAIRMGAVRITKDTVWCVNCAKDLPAAEAPAAAHARPPRSSGRMTPPNPGPRPQTRSHRSGVAPAAAGNSSKAPVVVGVLGALICLAGLIVFLQKPPATSEPQVKPDDPKTVVAPPATGDTPPKPVVPKDEYDPRATVAASYLEQAKAHLVAHPNDLETFEEKLLVIKDKYAPTPAGEEAIRILSEPRFQSSPADNIPPDSAWAMGVDVLSATDPAIDTLRGEWSRKGKDLVSSDVVQASAVMISLPYTPPPEFDVRIEFTRVKGNDCITLRAPYGRGAIGFLAAGWKNYIAGFEILYGKRGPDVASALKRHNMITNGKKSTLVLQIRRRKLKAYLNGETVVDTAINPRDVAISDFNWPTPYPERMLLASWESVFEIHRIDVLDVSGKGKLITSPARRTEPQRGLWASFWTAKDSKTRFEKYVLSQREYRLSFDIGDNAFDLEVPGDNFDIRYGGLLKVVKDGPHRFKFEADDVVKLWIDGKSVEKEKELKLKPGNHPIRVEYAEHHGGAHMSVKWRQPGEGDWREIPTDNLSYDPAQTAKYERP